MIQTVDLELLLRTKVLCTSCFTAEISLVLPLQSMACVSKTQQACSTSGSVLMLVFEESSILMLRSAAAFSHKPLHLQVAVMHCCLYKLNRLTGA